MSDQHETPDPEWWRTEAASEPAPEDQRRDGLADAAAHMREAAEMMRDAATPAAPPKESDWDLSWLTNWLKYAPNGKAFKRAAFSSGPAFAVLLWYYHQNSGNNAGAAAVFFGMLVGIAHLVYRRPFSQWVLWGAVLAPLYYMPAFISIIVGIAVLVAGGN